MNNTLNSCQLCGNPGCKLVYKGKIRGGKFGIWTQDNYSVLKCSNCNGSFLLEDAFDNYSSEEYRRDYNASSDIESYYASHDSEQISRVEKIGIDLLRNKIVLDYGCGGGAFLDCIKGVAKKTIGIEPFIGYHNQLKKNGHEVFSDFSHVPNNHGNEVDIVVSYGVIEHVKDPIGYLRNCFSILKVGGYLFIETDNANDILLIHKKNVFQEFFFRTVHKWYFCEDSLKSCLEQAGFNTNNILKGFRHTLDLSNFLIWLRDGVPSGKGKIKISDNMLEYSWKNYLETCGMADLLSYKIQK